ncbi:MAG: hypothetical protein EHM16_13420 [Betaproteobacteria bacterium]|nr:MAG: hypothetical protein EHM16_13420 [Betaproteobacteria bacterium]
MKRVLFVSLLATVLGAPGAVLAQAEKPATAKVEVSQAPKSASRRGGARADVDARECLKFATNMEIHRCAEKYR